MRPLAATLLTTALLLTGCSGADEPETPTGEATETPAANEADLEALRAVQVEGELGSEPTLDFDQPFQVSAPVAYVETEGDGETLEEGQSVSMHYLAVSGDDGTTLASTWELDQPEQVALGDPQIIPALTDALTGQSVGSRVLFAAPGSEASDTAPATPATVMVIEVIGTETIPERAEGTAVEPGPGLPLITLGENGAPEIEIPGDATEPTELVVQPLIEGEGEVVEAGQTVTVHYTGWLWDGTVFDSSWERGQPFQTMIGVGQVIPGWDEGLVGQTVGSQVLLIVPPAKGYGDQETGSIPANSTLVFVVDILAAS